MKEQLKVDPIINGTVIDHITAGKALQVIEILNIGHTQDEVMVGMNLNSKKMVKKDIIKIENRELSDEEANTIALISPTATMIIIKNSVVIKKSMVRLPQQIKGVILCPNPKCITNVEKVQSKFHLAKQNPIEVRCEYCEKKYKVDELKFSI